MLKPDPVSPPPPIAPRPVSGPGPWISVMIPTFNCAEYLGEALRSVLSQDPGVEKMEITVLDDASSDDPQAVVKALGAGRVNFQRHSANLGLTRNMNACIERATGDWVHLLHGDDYVLPGFYEEAMRLMRDNPEADLLAIRCQFIEAGGVTGESPDPGESPSRPSLRAAFLDGSPVQFAGMIVRRAVYERFGGFRLDLSHTADVEMWSRLLFQASPRFSSKCLAAYRIHAGNDTSRLLREGRNVRERRAVLPLLSANAGLSALEEKRYRQHLQNRAHGQCLHFAALGDRAAMRDNLRAWRAGADSMSERLRWARKAFPFMLRHRIIA